MTKASAVLTAAAGTLVLAGCASFNSNGLSDQYEDRLSRGLYATVGIGPSRLEPDTSEMADWNVNDRVEPAGQITVGADINKHLSIEAHSADLGSAGLSPTGRIQYHIDGVSALLYAGGNRDRYRRQGLTAFARVGVAALENEAIGPVPYEQTNGQQLLLGAGVEYMTSMGVGLRAEGISFDKDAKYAQLALMYRTGRKKAAERPKLAEAPLAQPVLDQPKIAAAVAVKPDPCVAVQGSLNKVYFETDNDELTVESMLVLNEVSNALSVCNSIEVDILAHTDSRGTAHYNHALSERRASSVIDYLATRGVSANRLRAEALGETSPIDTNATEQGMALNRRVEILAR